MVVVVVGIYRWRPQVRPARFTMFPSLTRLQNAQSCAPPVSDWVKSPPKRDRQLDKAPLELSYPNFYCFSLFSSAFISNALTSSPLIGHFVVVVVRQLGNVLTISLRLHQEFRLSGATEKDQPVPLAYLHRVCERAVDKEAQFHPKMFCYGLNETIR